MKLLGCIWSSQDVQREALSISLCDLTETLFNWVGEVKTLWSPLLRFKQPQQENTNWHPSFLQQQGGGDLTGHKDSRQAPWFINLHKTEKKS
jgi:hypothetical protein